MKTSNGDHADEFYFEDADLRLWEKRHFIISQILINNKYYKVFMKIVHLLKAFIYNT